MLVAGARCRGTFLVLYTTILLLLQFSTYGRRSCWDGCGGRNIGGLLLVGGGDRKASTNRRCHPFPNGSMVVVVDTTTVDYVGSVELVEPHCQGPDTSGSSNNLLRQVVYNRRRIA